MKIYCPICKEKVDTSHSDNNKYECLDCKIDFEIHGWVITKKPIEQLRKELREIEKRYGLGKITDIN